MLSNYLSGPDREDDSSSRSNLIGPSAHWSSLRRQSNSDELAQRARQYILQMLDQDRFKPR